MIRMKRSMLIVLLLISLAACTNPGDQVLSTSVVTSATDTIPLLEETPSSNLPPDVCPRLGKHLTFDTALPDTPDDPASYISRHYDEVAMPVGLTFERAELLTHESDPDEYRLSWVGRPEVKMVFLEHLECRTLDGQTSFAIADAIRVPERMPGYVNTRYCVDRSSLADNIIVFGKYDANQTQVTFQGRQGWKMYDLDFGVRINFESRKFEPLALNGLECYYLIE